MWGSLIRVLALVGVSAVAEDVEVLAVVLLLFLVHLSGLGVGVFAVGFEFLGDFFEGGVILFI